MKEKVAEKLIKKLLECSNKLDEVWNIALEIEDKKERDDFRRLVAEALMEGPQKVIEGICYQFPLLPRR